MQERSNNVANDTPACTECRRRKLRCSRELPTCKECRRLGAVCLYEAREHKPGMKPGAVENLNRRVDHVEKLISQLQQQIDPSTRGSEVQGLLVSHPPRAHNSHSVSVLLESFEKELRRFNRNSTIATGGIRESSNGTSQQGTSTSPSDNHHDEYSVTSDRQRKRRRLNSTANLSWAERILHLNPHVSGLDLTLEDLLDSIVSVYFTQVHPWIPMVHQGRFRRRLSMEPKSSSLEVLLHAMTVAAIRFVELDASVNVEDVQEITKQSRDFVILNAMNSLSVENLQALIIVAFDDGDAERAWSLVGSLTRTVEYLQLSIETEEVEEQPLLQPWPSLSDPEDWIEVEEQRRIFWNIFNLDRFCSVVTGWNTSLTSDDVHRCLPADGFLWRKGEAVMTPYFGIWDKSAGKIGNSIAFLPAQYSSPTRATDGMHNSPLASEEGASQGPGVPDVSTIGAFAYCIEATESMSQVTTYFLQQKINLKSPKHIESWLTRFKELDLRLVHWKMFLPQKWKDTKIVSQKSSEIIMDPNLTVAHVTHNASMILLHQLIAYPLVDWNWASRLPSRSSAETCQAAAIETAIITQNYLTSATTSKIFNSQFIFCIFIAARTLLVHWRYYSDPAPPPEFFAIIQSLDQISIRWQGYLDGHGSIRTNIAADYASQLRDLHERCTTDPNFRVDVLGYTSGYGKNHKNVSKPKNMKVNLGQRSGSLQTQPTYHHQDYSQSSDVRVPIHQVLPSPRTDSERTVSLAGPTQSNSYFYGQVPMNNMNGSAMQGSYQIPHPGSTVLDESSSVMNDYDLSSIAQMFFDQQYIDMDRVISFDDGMFHANMNYGDHVGL